MRRWRGGGGGSGGGSKAEVEGSKEGEVAGEERMGEGVVGWDH